MIELYDFVLVSNVRFLKILFHWDITGVFKYHTNREKQLFCHCFIFLNL